MNEPEIDWTERLQELEAKARSTRERWLAARDAAASARPFFVEFSGTPKSGKSSAVEIVRHFFRRNDFEVLAPAEGASRRTPAFLKGDWLAFNVWSACYSLTHLIERAYEARPYDLVLLDRGLFDVTCWMSLLEDRGKITPGEKEAIQNFFLLKRWTDLTDVVVLVTVDPEMALQREHRDRLSMAQGQAMNQEVLSEINGVYTQEAKKLGPSFRRFIHFDTTNPTMNLRETSYQIVSVILDELDRDATDH